MGEGKSHTQDAEVNRLQDDSHNKAIIYLINNFFGKLCLKTSRLSLIVNPHDMLFEIIGTQRQAYSHDPYYPYRVYGYFCRPHGVSDQVPGGSSWVNGWRHLKLPNVLP